MTGTTAQDFPFDSAVAIVGMSGRFPGANDPGAFWRNLAQGAKSIRFFSDDELLRAGVDPDVLKQPNYVKAGTVIDNVESFDASFFGFTPREAELMDPQIRLFLECSWEALEDAAVDTETYPGLVGVFAGSALSFYMINNIFSNPDRFAAAGLLQVGILNSADSLSTWVSYKFNLRGPSVAVQTFCSTSLVAVHLACQSLLTYECDMALAGGVAIAIPHGQGYLYQEGGIVSPDGFCRTFDASGQGSVMSNGLGVVALKRLDQAIADGDHIYAVIRGSAVNNDGTMRAGYTAPGLEGQSAVIAEALSNAGVDPDTISYFEAHGTATALGDSIELAATIRAFQERTDRRQFCALGSVKPNVGHLDRAAGVTGLIKTALALHHKQIPPNLDFEQTGPDIDLSSSPFFVNTKLRQWTADGVTPRRAGVSSFGLGGTNAHVVLQETPEQAPGGPSRPQQLLLLSAKTAGALDTATANLAAFLRANPAVNLADVAHTLRVGRAAFNHRRVLVCCDTTDAIAALERNDPSQLPAVNQAARHRPVAFLFAGVGEHYAGMAQELYESEPTFRATIDHCCAILSARQGIDLKHVLYPPHQPTGNGSAPALDFKALLGRTNGNSASGANATPLHQTALAQPAVFVVEYALAALLAEWGIRPQALLGYSLGEYVAATLAGVLSLEDALALVAKRAQLIQQLPHGAMLAVSLGEADVQPYLSVSVNLAVINSPLTCVLAGPRSDLEQVAQRLEEQEIACRWLETSHAFHSAMLAPISEELTALVRSIPLHPPQVPYLSNVTGDWITAEQATDPSYWARHLCGTVRFAEGIARLLADPQQVLLELGPGQALGSFVKQHPACTRERLGQVLATLPAAHEHADALARALLALGRMWQAGVTIDWAGLVAHEQRRRVSLPTYPFERQRYWVSPGSGAPNIMAPAPALSEGRKPDIADWFYLPTWEAQPAMVNPAAAAPISPWLVFVDETGFGAALAQRLERSGATVIRVGLGQDFAQLDPLTFRVRPDAREDYTALFAALQAQQRLPGAITHLWNLAMTTTADAESFQAAQRRGFYSLLHLAQALDGLELATTLPIMVLSHSTQPVSGDEPLNAEQAPGVAICRVFGQENPSLYCRNVDIYVPPAGSAEEHALLDLLLIELTTPTSEPMVAYRDGQRFAQRYRPERLQTPASPHPRLRQQGVYLITGGLGGVGLTLADYLARTAQARLALVGRSGLPPRDTWDGWLADHGPDDSVSRKIAKIRAIEALGAEVLILSADVGDAAQLRAAIDTTIERFGTLHGVIHGAGYLELAGFQLMRDLNREACEAHFRPKVYGLYLLEEALRDLPLDFCLLISSISAVLGGLRHSAYLAANHFMDLFVHRLRRTQSTCWISVNSDTWQLRVDQRALVGATVAQYEMTAAEGSEAFGRILERAPVQIVNSTGDLDARIRQWVLLETVRAAAPIVSAGYDRPQLETRFVAATSAYEQRVAAIWQQVLGINQVGIDDNFFDLGGNSLIALQVIAMLKKEFKTQVPTVALFEAPTVRTMVQYLKPEGAAEADRAESILVERRQRVRQTGGTDGIAIIGMTGRFPGAASVEEFWQNLHDGVEALTYFTDEELLAAGVPPELINDPNYIKARPVLKDDVALFDAAFFGYTPREAEFLDPQQRLFQECAWEALELAGYDTQRYKGLVGVFAGANLNLYLMRMFGDPELARSFNDTVFLENDKDALTTNVSYKLNLRGPSLAVQTYCSTSLVAVHVACRSLRSGECDMALAGGVSIRVPVQTGYLYQEGDQVSPDGHCRTFDAQAEGTTFGDGVAIVVLKRLADALADGDTIHAVIRGSAVNNDGGLKVGYTAPSVVGQAEAVAAALADATFSPETISYVEAHGTATRLGDPVEIASLTKAFRTATDKVGFCAISSTKPYTGHVDRAAGATGLIKTVLALQHEVIPPTLHFQAPNPEIAFADSPFYVTTALTPWQRNGHPRRAGVNALGVGGTNAHVIVEEAPVRPPSGPSRRQQLLLLSAKTASALEAQTANLAAFLRAHPDTSLADVASTLQVGRRVFNHRRALVCADAADALDVLERADARRLLSWTQPPASRALAFLFAGVGDHYVGMAQELYESEPTFRATVDRCCAILTPLLGQPIRRALYPTPLAEEPAPAAPALDFKALLGRTNGASGADATPLHQTALAQPAVFVVEYALAQLLAEWGIRPHAMLGYSLGEYVAATLAGVLSLDDALALVARRAQLIQRLPHGAMLAVSLGEADVQPYLSPTVNLAVINSPLTCVLAGPRSDLEQLAQRLEEQEIACRWLATSHAFHSAMLAPIADELTALVRSIPLHAPRIPYLSNVSGDWITEEQATDPTYWARHLCGTVRFADGVAHLLADPQQVLLELGPGQALGSFVKQHPACTRERLGQVLASVRGVHERGSDLAYLLTTLGRLWLLDVPIDWAGFSVHEQRRRIPLPTYPFERQRFWIEPNIRPRDSLLPDVRARRPDVGDWFTLASWKRGVPLDDNTITPLLAERQCWLLLPDQHGVGTALGDWLRRYGQDVVTVNPAAAFAASGPDHYTVRPDSREDYTALLRTLERQGREPRQVVHLWQVGPPADAAAEAELDYALRYGFFSLLALAQALGDQGVEQCLIDIVTSDMQEVTGHETLQVARSTVLGPVKVIPQEYANLSTRSIDLTLPPSGAPGRELIAQLGAELAQPSSGDPIALRGPHRWVQTYEPLHIPPPDAATPHLRQGGVYLITGGLGGIGLALADHLAATQQARLALVGRSMLPPRERWAEIIAAEGTESGIGRRVHLVQQIESRGAEVLVLQADVTDPAQIEAAVQQTLARFGTIHGVLHTAGVPGVGLMQLKTAATAGAELAPKVYGTLALTHALRDVPLDFLVLFSSVTSATGGGPGQVAYCAGNAFLDAYARRYRDRHGLTVAVSWGEWRWDAWSEGLQGFTEDVRAMFVTYRRTFGITFDEGADALRRILSRRFPHVFVTSDDLRPMVEFSKQSLIRRVEAQAQEQSRPAYPRPALGTSYAAPRNQTESAIAAIWSTVLGIEPIGVEDNFFELGGNSLLGIDLLARIHRALKIDRLPAYMLYEAPTVSALAEYIAQSQREQVVIDEPEPVPSGEKRQGRLDYFKRRALVEDLA